MGPGADRRDAVDEVSRPAGPVPGSGSSSSQAAGEDPDPAPPAGEAAEQDVERDLEALLGDAEAKRDEYLDIARRAQADFENYRKRMAAEVQAASLRGKAEVVRSFLPVVEGFERALEHAEAEANHDSGDDAVMQGWALVYRDLTAALAAAGVEVVDPKGEKFDPNQHEALSTIQVEGTEAGVVVEVMQKGYQFGGHLIRPARVVVAA
jgi:molecular chaperone GrpE